MPLSSGAGPKIPSDRLELYDVIGTGQLARLAVKNNGDEYAAYMAQAFLAQAYVVGAVVWSMRNRNSRPVFKLDSMKLLANWLKEGRQTVVEVLQTCPSKTSTDVVRAAESAYRFALETIESIQTTGESFYGLSTTMKQVCESVIKHLGPHVAEKLQTLLLIGIILPGEYVPKRTGDASTND